MRISQWILIIGVLLAAPATAQTTRVCIDMPTTSVTRNTEICNSIQELHNARTSSWALSDCEGELLRGMFLSLGSQLLEQTQREANRAIRHSNYPDRVMKASCGDGEKETWEECDDGNTRNRDGCSERCTIE